VGRHKAGWYLLAFGEVAPRFENRVTLDEARQDSCGIPAARIEYSPSADETRMIEHQKAALEEIARAAGLEITPMGSMVIQERILFRLMKGHVFDAAGAFLPGAAVHEAGGAAMGNDRRKSVLNRFNQCWDMPNLFVTDGACFVSPGSQNPTLTIMALTARACDYIATEMTAGSL
jgi:choline dehydrogenase-like flavoprotein